MNFTLPSLNYAHNGLEPIIDTDTVRIHHTLHHKTYVDNLNVECQKQGLSYSNVDLESVLQNPSLMENAVIRNNAGGNYNHSLYWYILRPLPNGNPNPPIPDDCPGEINPLAIVIVQKLIQQYQTDSNLDKFKVEFITAGMSRFGSGWVWLCEKLNRQENEEEFAIITTPNQDNPLMNLTGTNNLRPIIGIDLWEHAYYLNYQNRRKEYLEKIWSLIDWCKVQEVYNSPNGLPAGALD